MECHTWKTEFTQESHQSTNHLFLIEKWYILWCQVVHTVQGLTPQSRCLESGIFDKFNSTRNSIHFYTYYSIDLIWGIIFPKNDAPCFLPKHNCRIHTLRSLHPRCKQTQSAVFVVYNSVLLDVAVILVLNPWKML